MPVVVYQSRVPENSMRRRRRWWWRQRLAAAVAGMTFKMNTPFCACFPAFPVEQLSFAFFRSSSRSLRGCTTRTRWFSPQSPADAVPPHTLPADTLPKHTTHPTTQGMVSPDMRRSLSTISFNLLLPAMSFFNIASQVSADTIGALWPFAANAVLGWVRGGGRRRRC